MERIEVCVRVRPLNRRELDHAEKVIVETQGGNEILVGQASSKTGEQKKTGSLTSGLAGQHQSKEMLHPSQSYKFNNCFGEDTTTDELYERTIKRLVKSSLTGVNGTVFAYGPTGSGKTFTMMGGGPSTVNLSEVEAELHQGKKTKPVTAAVRSGVSPKRTPKCEEGVLLSAHTPVTAVECRTAFRSKYEAGDGLIIMAVRDLFRQIGIEASQGDKSVSILCSFFEIYNDQVYDLLQSQERLSEELPVIEVNNEFFTRGETESPIESLACLMEHLRKGEASRQYARTHMNHKSSRSHTIFRLKIRVVSQKDSKPNTSIQNVESMVAESILNFVDLAGSEKLAVHDSPRGTPTKLSSGLQMNGKQDRIKETKSINKSLFFLTQVISQLSKGCKDTHVPYRNSTLTKLLKNSLGGNARTALVLCISPAESYLPHTLSTLRFGVSAKRVCNLVKTNVYESCNLASLKQQLQTYEHKINQLELDNSKQRNESEELIELVRKLIEQKKELMERLVQLQNDPKMLSAPELLSKERDHVLAQTISIHQELEDAILKHSTLMNSHSPAKPTAPRFPESRQNPTRDLELETKLSNRNTRLLMRIAALKARFSHQRVDTRKQARILTELLGNHKLSSEDSNLSSEESRNEKGLFGCLSDKTLQLTKKRLGNAIKRVSKEITRRMISQQVKAALEKISMQLKPAEDKQQVDLLKSFEGEQEMQLEILQPELKETPLEHGYLGKRQPLDTSTQCMNTIVDGLLVNLPAMPMLNPVESKKISQILRNSGFLEPDLTQEDDRNILPDSLHHSLLDRPDPVQHATTVGVDRPELQLWFAPTLQFVKHVQTSFVSSGSSVNSSKMVHPQVFHQPTAIMVEDVDDSISVVSGCDLLNGALKFDPGCIPNTVNKEPSNSRDYPVIEQDECSMIQIVDLTNQRRPGADPQVEEVPNLLEEVVNETDSNKALSFRELRQVCTKNSNSKFKKANSKVDVVDCDAGREPLKEIRKLPEMQLEVVPGHSLRVPVPRQVVSRSLSDQLHFEVDDQDQLGVLKQTDSPVVVHHDNIFLGDQGQAGFDHLKVPQCLLALRQRSPNHPGLLSPHRPHPSSESKEQAKFVTPRSGRNSSAYHYTVGNHEPAGAFSFDRSSNKVQRRLDLDLLRVAGSPKENKPVSFIRSAKPYSMASHSVRRLTQQLTKSPQRR